MKPAWGHKLPFSPRVTYANVSLEVIHFEVWVSPVISTNGYQYYVHYVDEFSRFTWIYFLKSTATVTDVFLQFENEVEL